VGKRPNLKDLRCREKLTNNSSVDSNNNENLKAYEGKSLLRQTLRNEEFKRQMHAEKDGMNKLNQGDTRLE